MGVFVACIGVFVVTCHSQYTYMTAGLHLAMNNCIYAMGPSIHQLTLFWAIFTHPTPAGAMMTFGLSPANAMMTPGLALPPPSPGVS